MPVVRILMVLFAVLGALSFGLLGLGAMQLAGSLADSLFLSTGESTVLAGCGVTGAVVGAVAVLMTRFE